MLVVSDPIIYKIVNTGLTPGKYLLPSLNNSFLYEYTIFLGFKENNELKTHSFCTFSLGRSGYTNMPERPSIHALRPYFLSLRLHVPSSYRTSADYVRPSTCVYMPICLSVLHIYILSRILNILLEHNNTRTKKFIRTNKIVEPV